MIKKIGISTLILISLGVIYGLISQIYISLGAGHRLVEAQHEVNELEKENQRLKLQLQSEQTLSFIEKNARDKLLLARPGETIVIINPKKVEEVIASQSARVKQVMSNWQGWLKLFGVTF